ncbi:MAG: hypothetical protein MSJ87_08555 [Firmicutes bacterium]|nr:hypothetical protein [Bacillota bacterium]
MFKDIFKKLFTSNSDHHDKRLHPGEVEPGLFIVAGEIIDFNKRTYNGVPMDDNYYEICKDNFKPHID